MRDNNLLLPLNYRGCKSRPQTLLFKRVLAYFLNKMVEPNGGDADTMSVVSYD